MIFLGVMLDEDYRPAIAIAVVHVVALIGFAAFGTATTRWSAARTLIRESV